MPYYVVQRVMEALNEKKKSINGSNILLLGMAYKKDVDDPRESPSLKLLQLLEEKGARVSYNDPHIPRLKPMRRYSFQLESTELTAETLAAYPFILEHADLIVDTRNVFSGLAGAAEKVVQA